MIWIILAAAALYVLYGIARWGGSGDLHSRDRVPHTEGSPTVVPTKRDNGELVHVLID